MTEEERLPEPGTLRDQRKADRRKALLDAAARLFADRGYGGVSMRDLGAAVDVSGPAIYRHFASKQDVLVELLVGISERLLANGQRQAEESTGPADALRRLVDAHVAFAVSDIDLIRVQDRDLASLNPDAQHQVRRLQRQYVEIWVAVLRQLDPELPNSQARVRAHAAFGLINSTPHGFSGVAEPQVREILARMALQSLAGDSR
ncbi:TetR/AcrR family transcriptional regulator [Tomitella biformata]|uniref:TetR/AcrR family transcriptional regulator n=1 Tax=Tomitella biformata TaxID=630403 RepID=UPI000467CEEC|nr:TetR/AcrR family transcriptional regulator [Tomitella biformata]